MSERYTQTFQGIFDNKESRHIDIPNVSAVLNDRDRLAAEVETLRALLRECFAMAKDVDYHNMAERIDAALATSGETP